jgi:hypothetical protein
MPDHNSSKDEMSSPRLRRKKIQFSDDYGENIDKVHQDEDYSKFLVSCFKYLEEECRKNCDNSSFTSSYISLHYIPWICLINTKIYV